VGTVETIARQGGGGTACRGGGGWWPSRVGGKGSRPKLEEKL
jgi:hypothetical protein